MRKRWVAQGPGNEDFNRRGGKKTDLHNPFFSLIALWKMRRTNLRNPKLCELGPFLGFSKTYSFARGLLTLPLSYSGYHDDTLC